MLKHGIAFGIQWQHYASARVSEADVKRYYLELKDFFDGNTVRASHIVLRVPPGAPAADVEAARTKLTALRTELVEKKGDFAALAKEHSQCPSKEGGGDIGYITRKWGMVDEDFARTAFSLPKDEISPVVQTAYGLHLIRVTDRKAGQPSDYNKIKNEVREFYIEEMRQRLLDQMRKTAKIEVHKENLP
jgi:parvulin-like peptidyl-prolyl isomerase